MSVVRRLIRATASRVFEPLWVVNTQRSANSRSGSSARERLVGEDVQAGAGDGTVAERVDQRRLVDQCTAGYVDHERAGPHPCERIAGEEAVAPRREAGGDEDDVARRAEHVEVHLPEPRHPVLGGIDRSHVAAADLHPEGGGAARDRGANRADPDDAGGHAAQRAALDLAPPSVEHRRMHEVRLPGEHQQMAHRQVGHLLAEDAGSVEDRQAEPGRGVEVDRVGPHAPLDDRAKTGRLAGLEHAGVDHVVARDHRVGTSDELRHRGRVELLAVHLGQQCVDAQLLVLGRSSAKPRWR